MTDRYLDSLYDVDAYWESEQPQEDFVDFCKQYLADNPGSKPATWADFQLGADVYIEIWYEEKQNYV